MYVAAAASAGVWPCSCVQRTPAWVVPRKSLTPSWAVPAAHHSSAFTLWLRRVAFYWRSELTFGVAMTKNLEWMLKMVCTFS